MTPVLEAPTFAPSPAAAASTVRAAGPASGLAELSAARVLIVDDDENLLQGLRRQLRREFNLEVATGPRAGIDAARDRGPFAVVVADMQMPEMNGVQFFRLLTKLDPDAVRIMLTGNLDQQTAVDAVNDGHIFRFLHKPCAREELAKAIAAGLAQHRLVAAEKELVSRTLTGSVKVLTDVLALALPQTFRGVAEVRRLVRAMATELLPDRLWECELASMLCRLGDVTLPEEVRGRRDRGLALSDADRRLLAGGPEVAARLISNIPRLAGVAEIVRRQDCDAGQNASPQGSRILRAALDYCDLLARGLDVHAALAELEAEKTLYGEEVLGQLFRALRLQPRREPQSVSLDELADGMVLAENVVDAAGELLVPAGAELSAAMIARLRQFHLVRPVRTPLRVVGGFAPLDA